jgi:hypothetical protein
VARAVGERASRRVTGTPPAGQPTDRPELKSSSGTVVETPKAHRPSHRGRDMPWRSAHGLDAAEGSPSVRRGVGDPFDHGRRSMSAISRRRPPKVLGPPEVNRKGLILSVARPARRPPPSDFVQVAMRRVRRLPDANSPLRRHYAFRHRCPKALDNNGLSSVIARTEPPEQPTMPDVPSTIRTPDSSLTPSAMSESLSHYGRQYPFTWRLRDRRQR